ncbi:MAG: DNA-processing protein DprA [Pseudomonadota bacterium]
MNSLPSPHPLTPPRSEDDWVAWFRLLRSRRVGATTFHRLISEHGSARDALAALPEVARAAGVAHYAVFSEAMALAELDAGRLAGAVPIAFGTDAYPTLLAQLPDAPPVLWTLGDPTLLQRPRVAMVGARNASSLGTRMAKRMAGELAEAGYVVVSGLARGVDTAAHLAALSGGTIAVFAGGVDVVYPPENASLAQEIEERGLRLSEQPMGQQPTARHFPARNRIISGLTQAVVVIEAAARSGSLITARTALDQGREVMAVPGHPFDARATGCNFLLRDGATLVRNATDVIEVLEALRSDVVDNTGIDDTAPQAESAAPAAAPVKPETAVGLRDIAALHQCILDRLTPSPLAEDQLIRDLGVAAQDVSPALINLELEGQIERRPGGLLAKAC